MLRSNLVIVFGVITLSVVDALLGIKIEPTWKDIVHTLAIAAFGAIFWHVITD